MTEIERKFLVVSEDFKKEAFGKIEISQGYLNSHPERSVRIRIKGESGYLTIKGKGNETGMTRLEWETELPLAQARPLLAICESGIIKKVRFQVKSGSHIFEIDEFFGDNEGMVVAEIELKSEAEPFEKPAWLGLEVTNDKRYYNAYLSKNPFKTW